MNFGVLSMEISLLLCGILLIIFNLFGIKRKRTLGILALLGIVIDAIIGIITLYGKNTILLFPQKEVYKGFIYFVDPLAFFFKELFCLILFLVVLISIDYSEKNQSFHQEYFPLLLFTGVGMMMMTSSGDFLTLFISMELISIPLYVLASFNKNRKESAEAGLKYFILGAFSSALFLFGISMLYGLSGSLAFIDKGNDTIPTIINGMTSTDIIGTLKGIPGVFMMGVVFLILGFGFKIAAAPFHMWAPDVYEGSPIPITAFISAGPKAAGIAVILRFFIEGISNFVLFWAPLFAIMSILSIFIGNLAALRQDNIKRLLAYSGIAQMGYILLGIIGAAGDVTMAKISVVFYITIYVLTNLGAFAVAILCCEHYKSEKVEKFTGLYKKSPSLAFIMVLALLSLAGIPPLSGFIGKFYLFLSAYTAFQNRLAVFVLIAIVFSVISLFYYLRVLKYMFFEATENTEPIEIPGYFKLALSISSLSIIFLGLVPPFYTIIKHSTNFLRY